MCSINFVNIRDNLRSLVCATVLCPERLRNISASVLRTRSGIVHLCDFVAILHELAEDGLTQWPKHVAGGTRLK